MTVTDLAGKRILVVEDSFYVATEVQELLEEAGACVVGPHSRVEDALTAATAEELDAALLDVNLDGEFVYPVADALAERQIPFLFATGYDVAATLPERFLDRPAIEKPFDERRLLRAARKLVNDS